MENVLVKYSDFFNDDGGFDKIRKDFDDLGDDLIKKAKEVKGQVKLFSVDDNEGVKQAEAQTEALVKALAKLQKAQLDVSKVEEEYRKQIKRTNETQDDKVDKLVDLDTELNNLKKRLKEVTDREKKSVKVVKEDTEQRIDLTLRIKDLNKEIAKNQKEILQSNELSVKEQKLLKAKITLEKEEIRTLTDVRERLAALRLVVQSLDLEEQADEIRAYNNEINGLTDILSDNSDKFIQAKINIGNYEEAITNALKGTNLFSGQLSILNGVFDKLIEKFVGAVSGNKANEEATEGETKAIIKNTIAVNANTAATEANTKANNKNILSLNKLKGAFKGFSGVLKASGILLLITAIASIGTAFSQGRAGTILAEKTLARFSVTARVFVNVLGDVGQGVIQIFKGIGGSFGSFINEIKIGFLEFKRAFSELPEALGGSEEAVNSINKRILELRLEIAKNEEQSNYSEGWNKIANSISGASDQIDNAVASLNTLDEAAIKIFQLSDAIKLQELNLIALRKEVQLLEIESGDSTISLNKQLEATEELLEKRLELIREENDIALKNLEIANAKARADAEAAGFNLSRDEVEFAKQLLDLNIRLDESRGENQLNDEFLTASQDALKEYLTTLNELPVAEKEIAKQRREIQRDLFEQNIDLLIDLIDTEKNISQDFVNDVTKNFQRRLNEFNSFLIKFRSNSQLILNEFSQEANNLGLDLDFDIQFDEDGNFEVFIGDTKLAIDNILELNEQLQGVGLNEIDINRFREFIIETRNGVSDFRDLNKELKLAAIGITELSNNIIFTQDELTALDALQNRIDELAVSSRGKISQAERKKILEELERLEEEKTKIASDAETKRLVDRQRAIDEELNLVDVESQRYFELLQERLDIEKQLRDKGISESIESEKDKNKKIIEEEKKAAAERRQIVSSILDAAVRAQEKTVESTEKRVDKQEELIDTQRRRAELGLTNTLAFEQRELGKREAEKIKQERRLERLEKIKALYASYNSYSSQGDGQNAIVKALRDFAILESITASFGEGGIVEDKLPSNGIFRGRSHQGKNGGIPILVEGKEGIFSTREMENLGKDNFYKMKDLASLGKVDSNFFSKQGEAFVKAVPVSGSNGQLIEEMKQVKRAIEGKPSQRWDAFGVVNGAMELVETITTKNKVKRNHYKVKKPRP